MRVRIATYLPVSAERLWNEVRKPRLLQHVCRPLQTFQAIDPPTFGETWEALQYTVRIRMFDRVPLGKHRIVVSFPSTEGGCSGQYRLRDNGTGDFVTIWDHMIKIKTDGRAFWRQ